jgi:hypothetical protein
MQQQQHLEKQVAETAAVVVDWKSTIAKIETQLNIANVALMRAKKERVSHTLPASQNNAVAVKASSKHEPIRSTRK